MGWLHDIKLGDLVGQISTTHINYIIKAATNDFIYRAVQTIIQQIHIQHENGIILDGRVTKPYIHTIMKSRIKQHSV